MPRYATIQRAVLPGTRPREWLVLGTGELQRVVTIGDELLPWHARRYEVARCESGCGKVRCYPGRTCGDQECIDRLAR